MALPKSISSHDTVVTEMGASAISALGSVAKGKGSVVIGRRIVNDQPVSVAFGDGLGYPADPDNRTFHLHRDGSMSLRGPIYGGLGGHGIGAYFPNESIGTIERGMLVAIRGKKIGPASIGDKVFGVVQPQCMMVSNSSPFCWSERYLKDEYGQIIYEDYYDKELQETWKRPKQNPEYDHSKPYVPRSERPDEWTLIVLWGRCFARVDNTVNDLDPIISSSALGIGTKATGQAVYNMRCMSISTPYGQLGNYAIADSLLGVGL